MTDDELQAIEARGRVAAEASIGIYADGLDVARAVLDKDAPALVAEVRRLREALDLCAHARDLNQTRARVAEALCAEAVPVIEGLIRECGGADPADRNVLEKLKTIKP